MGAAIGLGIDRFSMQGIAAQLGVTTPALYSHVRGRDDVLQLVADHLLGQIELESTGAEDWEGWLRSFGHQVRRHIAGPESEPRVALRQVFGAQLAIGEVGLVRLTEAGFSPADAARALWLVFRIASTAGPAHDASVSAPIAQARRVMGRRKLPVIERAMEDLGAAESLDTFEFDLEVVLQGLRTRVLADAKNRNAKKAPPKKRR